jgi:hypothetical protein
MAGQWFAPFVWAGPHGELESSTTPLAGLTS